MGTLVIPRKPAFKKDARGQIRSNYIKPAKTVPNFGVELEMGLEMASIFYSDFHKGAMAEIERRIGGYYSCHEDCGALEIVSVPLNFNEIRLYLKTLLETPIIGQKAIDPNQHGMHVHYGNKFMAGSHLERVLRFLMNQDAFNKKFVRFIAGRSIDTGWANLPSFNRFISRHVYERSYSDLSWHKRESERIGVAINTYHKTHEFRLFATTNSADRACANVEFVAALADLFRDKDSESYQTNTKKFISLVKDNADIYPHLVTLIGDRFN